LVDAPRSPERPFSLAVIARELLAQTWPRSTTPESAAVAELERKYGASAGSYFRVPDYALRDLNVGTPGAGGYLADNLNIGYVGSLLADSVALTLGAQIVDVGANGALLPRGTAAASTTWLATETSTISESQPTFGQVAGTPKLLGAFCEVSRQLLLQSNVDQVVRGELRRACGAALDAAVFAGSGASGQPTGIANVAGIGAFTGGTLNNAALRDAQADVAAANGVFEKKFGYVTTPAVAELLGTRQRFTGSDRTAWEGPLSDGIVEGVRAMASTSMPTDVMIFGDFSAVLIAQWAGGLQISIDPFTKFKEGIVGIRALFAVDIMLRAPQAFSVATSIT
jgi:HK97 family phage major capsid protein